MRALIACMLVGTMALVSCEKEPEAIGSDQVLMVVDQAIAERCLLPLWPIFSDLAIGPGNWLGVSSNACLVLDSLIGDTTAFPDNGPLIAFLTFNDQGCLPPDAALRSGQVIVSFDSIGSEGTLHGRFRSPDLMVDEHRVRMFASWQRTGTVESRLDVDTSSVYLNGDWSRRFRGSLAYRLIDGMLDGSAESDVYGIATDLFGSDREGTTFGCSTSTELRAELGCKWLVSGVERFDVSDELARELDLGPGSCDAVARITAETTVFGLTIP